MYISIYKSHTMQGCIFFRVARRESASTKVRCNDREDHILGWRNVNKTPKIRGEWRRDRHVQYTQLRVLRNKTLEKFLVSCAAHYRKTPNLRPTLW